MPSESATSGMGFTLDGPCHPGSGHRRAPRAILSNPAGSQPVLARLPQKGERDIGIMADPRDISRNLAYAATTCARNERRHCRKQQEH
jgi:hypothetical protein